MKNEHIWIHESFFKYGTSEIYTKAKLYFISYRWIISISKTIEFLNLLPVIFFGKKLSSYFYIHDLLNYFFFVKSF